MHAHRWLTLGVTAWLLLGACVGVAQAQPASSRRVRVYMTPKAPAYGQEPTISVISNGSSAFSNNPYGGFTPIVGGTLGPVRPTPVNVGAFATGLTPGGGVFNPYNPYLGLNPANVGMNPMYFGNPYANFGFPPSSGMGMNGIPVNGQGMPMAPNQGLSGSNIVGFPVPLGR